MIGHEPYASHRDQINVRGVLLPSQESGCDEPSRGVHKRTALGCTFDSLGSERYMLTEDNRAMRDIAQAVPYDVLYIMVNHERYGGGGIYNLFCTFTSDNQWSEYVFLHEFGHSFAGLADEYYTSNVAYTDFYPPRTRTARAQHHRPAGPGAPEVGRPGHRRRAAHALEQGRVRRHGHRLPGEARRRSTTASPNSCATGRREDEIAAAKAEGEELSLEHQQEVDAWFAGQSRRGTWSAPSRGPATCPRGCTARSWTASCSPRASSRSARPAGGGSWRSSNSTGNRRRSV